jgi:arylsulfatase A-like enzyme
MSGERRNLILLTIDAWRPDFVDEHAGVALTPSLAALASRTARFEHVYANGPWTTPAMVSVFTGESPARHGVHFEWSSPRPDGEALAARLARAGWAVPNLCYLNRLDNYRHLGYDAADAPDYPHSPDDDLVIPAIREHRERREPFFLWFHYKFVHLPYWPRAGYRARLGVVDEEIPERLRASVCTGFVVPRDRFHLEPVDRPLVRRLYAAGVAQMNDWLARVIETLAERGLDERTTLVVTSDHGEELLDHGHVGHASTAHHATLHEEVLRVPLLVVDARVRGPRRISARVQGRDLYPTLCALAGIGGGAADDAAGGSRDLSPAILGGEAEAGAIPDGRAFYFHSARMGCPTPRSHAHQYVEGFSDGRIKLVAERYDEPRDVVYDLAADPGETAPITDGPLLAEARRRLEEVRRGAR